MRKNTNSTAAAQATKVKQDLYVVTLPDEQIVFSSNPLLHNQNGVVAFKALTTESVKKHAFNLNAILMLAKLLMLCKADQSRIIFKPSNKVIAAYLPWINIFQFLLGQKIGNIYSDHSFGSHLARFSACIARPSLLLATDDVVRAALCGDEDLACRMIEANPNYLLQRGNATDFSGRTFPDITPFEAALITGDVEMAEMMKPFFARLENGESKMKTQFDMIFPLGNVEMCEDLQRYVSKSKFLPMLEAVIAAIRSAKSVDLQAALSLNNNNSALCDALDTFRAAFTELSLSDNKKGFNKIFNPYHLLTAFEAFATKFDWNNSDTIYLHLHLFWRQVIGFVQRFLPANYAQVFAHSLYDIVEKELHCPRSFNFQYDPDFSFYPLSNSWSGLGFNYAGVACMGGGLRKNVLPVRGSDQFFSKLVSNKNSKLSVLIPPREQWTIVDAPSTDPVPMSNSSDVSPHCVIQ